MTIKSFYFSQPADMRIEGVGIHASYSIDIVIKDENSSNGKNVYISTTGKSNAARAAGTGSLLFWCKVRDLLSNKIYSLERKKGEGFAVGFDDFVIGSTMFHIPYNSSSAPKIELEAGYLYDAGYAGTVIPFPRSLKRVIALTQFNRR